MMERGSRVMSGVHKRCYYAMRLEFKILARICGESLPPEYPYDVYGGPREIKSSDFDNRVDILPVADPNIMSMAQRVIYLHSFTITNCTSQIPNSQHSRSL